jgi:muramidase (phage lysozyme)
MPENKEPLNFAAGGIVSYLNQGATRRMPVTENLQARMAEAVQAVYGPGYTIGIYSGGQAEKGSGGPRTGSVRHDLGRAGDVYVFDPNGNKVTGDALAPLGQYWQARKYGGTGMEMHGGGIHLDEWEQPPSGGGMAWNYADQGGRYTKAQQAAIEAGQRGELPQLYGGATMASASSALTPHQMALVRTIYGDESGGKYNVVYGGGTFDTSGGWKHPGIYNQITSGPNAGQRSSAAGAGQFLESTWNDVAKRYGLKDFSPANQDLATYYLAKEKYGPDLDAVLASGDPNALAKVGQSLSGTWTSLPGGIESAGGTDRFVSAYQNALNNSGAGTAMASAANATTAANAELAAGAGAGEAAAGGMDPLTMMASLAKLGGGAAQPQAPTGGGAPQQPAIPYREEEIMRQRSQVSPLRRIA